MKKRMKLLTGVGMVWLFCIGTGSVFAGAASRKENSGEGIFTYQKVIPLSVNSVSADLDNLDFTIRMTKKKEPYLSYKIDCKNSTNPLSWRASDKDKVLYLKESGIERLSLKERQQKYGRNHWGQGHWPKVTLYVPEDVVLKSSTVRMGEGDFTAGKGLVCQNIDVQVKYGDVFLSGFRMTGEGKIRTVDGDVKCGAFCVDGNLQVTSKYGDVQAAFPKVSGILCITTGEGDITALGMQIQGKVKMLSGEGDIVTQPDKQCRKKLTVTVDSRDGDVHVPGDMGGEKKKRRGCGWHYKRKGGEKGNLRISVKYGDVLLK